MMFPEQEGSAHDQLRDITERIYVTETNSGQRAAFSEKHHTKVLARGSVRHVAGPLLGTFVGLGLLTTGAVLTVHPDAIPGWVEIVARFGDLVALSAVLEAGGAMLAVFKAVEFTLAILEVRDAPGGLRDAVELRGRVQSELERLREREADLTAEVTRIDKLARETH
jgi:hypothetical protein